MTHSSRKKKSHYVIPADACSPYEQILLGLLLYLLKRKFGSNIGIETFTRIPNLKINAWKVFLVESTITCSAELCYGQEVSAREKFYQEILKHHSWLWKQSKTPRRGRSARSALRRLRLTSRDSEHT